MEPALLAQLVAESADQPGALPLLQYALTDLFDHRADATLKLTEYRALGGLRGILSRRAETLYEQMNPDQQRAAMQVFLRLVRPGRGTIDSRRRIPLQDLTDLDLDPVVLSDVLGAFADTGCCRSIATLSRASPWWRSPMRRCCANGTASRAGSTAIERRSVDTRR